MQIVVSAASDSARLTTLAQAKLALNLGPSQVTDEALIRAEIDRSSIAAASWIGRPLARQQYTQTWRNVSSCSLLLDNFPVVSIDTVTADGVELAASDYEFDIQSGMLWRLTGDIRIAWSASKVVLEYTAGWVLPEQTLVGSDPVVDDRDLPLDIEAAALELVKIRYYARTRDPMVKSESIPGVMTIDYGAVTSATDSGLPEHVVALLNPYRVPAFA
jgi:hypothetical protein